MPSLPRPVYYKTYEEALERYEGLRDHPGLSSSRPYRATVIGTDGDGRDIPEEVWAIDITTWALD